MIRRLAPIVLLALASCAEPETVVRPYSWNDLRLVTAYTAKAVCSCLFVEQRNEEQCRAFAIENPPVADWSADADAKTVRASALLLWGSSARFVNEKFGCVLDD